MSRKNAPRPMQKEGEKVNTKVRWNIYNDSRIRWVWVFCHIQALRVVHQKRHSLIVFIANNLVFNWCALARRVSEHTMTKQIFSSIQSQVFFSEIVGKKCRQTRSYSAMSIASSSSLTLAVCSELVLITRKSLKTMKTLKWRIMNDLPRPSCMHSFIT